MKVTSCCFAWIQHLEDSSKNWSVCDKLAGKKRSCFFHSMDPLGAPSQFVDVDSLPGWTDVYEAKQLNSHQNPVERAQVDVRSPFPYRKDINAKIILWKGDVALLNCTAIVNTSNESLTDKNPVSESVFMHAGPDLRDELQKLKGKCLETSCCIEKLLSLLSTKQQDLVMH
ncbi:ganglioside-induced differentiation-associated protein 2-like [Apteryx rowi]|uniref:ganglioside-induced differentiation-associated protein 2-like n=1 Tax=Apteryx rowi TaxID=308060 RepID=UPI000E1E16F5|nr:ganglioside-induced differentiation-associated protein 2-like [Apteryx rowi]